MEFSSEIIGNVYLNLPLVELINLRDQYFVGEKIKYHS